MSQTSPTTRLIAVLAFAAALVAVAAMLLRSEPYELVAEFPNLGRVVEGGEVRVAGLTVGEIDQIDLTDEGLAAVTIKISDDSVTPLRIGTRARIRARGAATLTNNFIELSPGPESAPALDDGATLGVTRTAGIVDVDAILSSLDEKARGDIQALTGRSAEVFAGSGAEWFNGMLAQLSPAMAELREVADDLSSDRARIDRFIEKGAEATQAIASRRPDLVDAVENTATTLAALDSRRTELGSLLNRAPAVLTQARGTLTNASRTLEALRPTLRKVPAAAAPAQPFLERLSRFLTDGRPALRQLNDLLPDLDAGLRALPQLRGPARAALPATASAFQGLRPMLRGLRFYAPDVLVGVFNGLLMIATGNYNKYGHYIHVSFVQSPEDSISGPLSALLPSPLAPGVINLRDGFREMCPGAANPPAPDGSNDYVPDPSLCDPAAGLPPEVNTP